MFCRSLFLLLYFFFWQLCCLFFFDVGVRITPLLSSSLLNIAPLRGSITTNEKKQKTWVLSRPGGLCIFNDSTNTYVHLVNEPYSAVNLAVTVPSLLLGFSCHDDLCGSDNFSIILESLNSSVGERPTRYKLDKVDWPLYE